jgi:hypothetical protein
MMTRTIEISDETFEKIKDQLAEEEVIEVENMDSLVGKKWAFQCARYIYFGKVKQVNNTFIELEEAQTVFETGDYSAKEASDAQDMPKNRVLVMRQAIESVYPVRW